MKINGTRNLSKLEPKLRPELESILDLEELESILDLEPKQKVFS